MEQVVGIYCTRCSTIQQTENPSSEKAGQLEIDLRRKLNVQMG